MSDCIRQLENGLAILQSSVLREPHPLLAHKLLRIESVLELHAAAELPPDEHEMLLPPSLVQAAADDWGDEPDAAPPLVDALGTLALRDDGAATFYGRSAGSEVRAHARASRGMLARR